MALRQANGSDALYEDCVGPSVYWKAQGLAVRVWGLLANGVLYTTVLPDGACMNRWWYEWIIDHRFPAWKRKAFGRRTTTTPSLVQDHERCLWAPEPRAAMVRQGIKLLTGYPKCSQDLNPIEEAWREVRARLATTQPVRAETRDAFIVRHRAAVEWVNRNRSGLLKKICSSQKAWAQDVLDAKGCRTVH